ncbi:MAG: glutaredoxin family protein [Gemmatimonadota bacterium]
MKQLLPQRCPVAALQLSWLLYAGGLVFFAVRGEYPAVAVWLVALPAGVWAYVRLFPRLSPLLGYGSVRDVAAAPGERAEVVVTVYTSLGCPFCPIVEERLRALRSRMGFELREVDVTLKPQLRKEKGLRAVPVVEAGDRRLAGNATSHELATFISAAVERSAPAAQGDRER